MLIVAFAAFPFWLRRRLRHRTAAADEDTGYTELTNTVRDTPAFRGGGGRLPALANDERCARREGPVPILRRGDSCGGYQVQALSF